MENKMDIAFIADENFILPTSVAVASLIKNNNYELQIHIITPGVSSDSKKKLKSLETKNAKIKIYDVDNEFLSVSTGELFDNIPANHSSLLKFNLPIILKDVDKLLYLDGDLIVNNNISSLFNIDLKDNLVAAVSDNIADWHLLKLNLKKYFNSGVMLLNLKKMREENYTKTLIEYRINGFNKFMDQDAFNVVFAGKVVFLPFRYNTMYSIIEFNTPKQIKNIYNSPKTMSYDELIEDSLIIHFSSNKKPWKYIIPGLCLLYKQYLDLTPFKDYKFDYIGKSKNLFNSIKYLDLYKETEEALVSIVVPAHNMEKTIEKTIKSLINQTLKEIEIILVDDASTDKTLPIFNKYAKLDKRIKVISNKDNVGTCAARTQGGLATTGKFVMFIDGDDEFELSTCEELYKQMILNDADIIQFKTKIISNHSTSATVKDFDKYINQSYDFLSQEEIIHKSFINKTLSRNIWNRIYKKEIIHTSFKFIENGYFIKSEDLYASLLIAFHSKNMVFVNKAFYIYNIGLGITATNKEIDYDKFSRISTGIDVVGCIIRFIEKYHNEENYIDLLSSIIKHCFTENNWWLKFVNPKDFNKCLDLCFEKYLKFLPYTKNKVISTALAKTLDTLFLTIHTNKSETCKKIVDYFSKIEDFENIFSTNSHMYQSYIMNKQNAVNIVFNINNNDFPYLASSIYSICKNASTKRLYNIYIFGNGLYNKYIDKVLSYKNKNINITVINDCKEASSNIQKGMNGNVAYKIFATYYLSFLDKILYISYDSITNVDLAELFNIDIGDNIIATPQEYNINEGLPNGNICVNTMLIQTKPFNNIDIKNLYFNAFNKRSEREFFNAVFKNKSLLLENKWCFQWHIPYKEIKEDPENCLIHFGSDEKPWKNPSHIYADEFWKYARETEFYEEIIFNNLKKVTPTKQENVNRPQKRTLWVRYKGSVKDIGFFPTIKKASKKAFRKIFRRGVIK